MRLAGQVRRKAFDHFLIVVSNKLVTHKFEEALPIEIAVTFQNSAAQAAVGIAPIFSYEGFVFLPFHELLTGARFKGKQLYQQQALRRLRMLLDFA